MKIFARFNKQEDHEKLVNSLIKERMLREVIEQLKFFKSKGCVSLDQIEKFIETQKKKSSQNSSYMSYDKTGADKNNFVETQELIKNPGDFISSKNANLIEQSLNWKKVKLNLDLAKREMSKAHNR